MDLNSNYLQTTYPQYWPQYRYNYCPCCGKPWNQIPHYPNYQDWGVYVGDTSGGVGVTAQGQQMTFTEDKDF